MRRTLKIVSFFMLLLALSTCSAFPALAEVGPGVSQSTETGVNNNAENGIDSSGLGISTLPAVGQTTWGWFDPPSLNVSYLVTKDTCTFQYALEPSDVSLNLDWLRYHSADKAYILREPGSSYIDNGNMRPFKLPNGTEHSYALTVQQLAEMEKKVGGKLNRDGRPFFSSEIKQGFKILETISYHEDDPMLETHYRVTAIIDKNDSAFFYSEFIYEKPEGFYIAVPFILPDGRQVGVSITEAEWDKIIAETPPEVQYVPITEYFPINP